MLSEAGKRYFEQQRAAEAERNGHVREQVFGTFRCHQSHHHPMMMRLPSQHRRSSTAPSCSTTWSASSADSWRSRQSTAYRSSHYGQSTHGHWQRSTSPPG